MRNQLGVPARMRPWTGMKSFAGRGVPRTARALEIIDLAAIETLGSSAMVEKALRNERWLRDQVVAADLVVDISQNPIRKAFTKNGKWPCLTTSSQVYSFARDSMLLPLEYMLLQGHRRTLSIPRGMKPSELRDLAGEGMSLPCLALLVWCMVLVKGLP